MTLNQDQVGIIKISQTLPGRDNLMSDYPNKARHELVAQALAGRQRVQPGMRLTVEVEDGAKAVERPEERLSVP